MEKIDIEKEELVDEEKISKIDIQIEELKNKKDFVNDDSTPLSTQKQTLANLISIRYLELLKDKYKVIYNFQKKNDHGFYSIKSSNEELQKVTNSITLVYKLSYLIDFSYYNATSIKYSIIDDLKNVNMIITYILDELPNDNYYKNIIDSLKKTDNNFNHNCDEILKKETNNIGREIKEIKQVNQELMTKHIISKNIFDMVKEYLDMISNNSKKNKIDNELKDEITNEFINPNSNDYYDKIKRLNDIENNFNNIDEKYRKAIKKYDIAKSLEILEKLEYLYTIKKYIKTLSIKQKNILRSFSKKQLFFAYMKYLEELVCQIDKDILLGREELEKNNISEYIELFDLINSLITFDKEIKSYENKISNTNVDTEIISYNNKITAFTIKKRRVDISLLKNRFFDSSLIDKTMEISKSNENSFELTSNIDDEIRKCNESLSKCYDNIEDKELMDNLYNQYVSENLQGTIDFAEYLIIKNNYIGAKLYTLKNKLLDLVYSKYIQSDMDISFAEYLNSNPILNIDDIITDYEITEFEKSKVKDKTKEKKNI